MYTITDPDGRHGALTLVMLFADDVLLMMFADDVLMMVLVLLLMVLMP